jgi:Ca-activated chloride channel homolog
MNGCKKYLLTTLLCLCILPAFSQKNTRILFLLDASGSMWAKMETDNRITVAKNLLSKMVDSLKAFDFVEVGLRVYGHTSPKAAQNCKDTRLEVPFGKNNTEDIKKKLQTIRPSGTTLIAYSLTQAAYDFPQQDGWRNIIILITDGLEECDGDPCAVSEALQKQGVMLRPFVIGVGGGGDFASAFECVGRYFDAKTESDFENILSTVISQALNATTAQVNLLDIKSRATETNVNMTFYDSKSHKIIYNYIHTMNDRGVPDTLVLDPSYKYDLVVHTIPPVTKYNIEVLPGKHNIIAVDAPQGDLLLKMEGVTNYEKLLARISQNGKTETINVQEFNTQRKYIVGKYDLEILTTPRVYITSTIAQSSTTSVTIPQPGKLILMLNNDFVGGIFTINQNQLEWVCDFDTRNRKQTLLLQPGKYKLIFRPQKANLTVLTSERNFEITSGGSTHIILN